jgi:SAM-dependent methyltransferase
MKDVLGQALTDYYLTVVDETVFSDKLWVHNKYGRKEEMPVKVYFRNIEEMPELEWVALQQCRGRILDIGAGAGSHSLALQQMGQDVTALEISPMSAAVIKERGVRRIRCEDFFALNTAATFDTLLLMMNGIGLAGTLDGLRMFLRKARLLLRPGGQLVFDSSDIAYLYGGRPPKTSEYYGEILYQYVYRRQHSDWFHWLFIDRATLSNLASSEGWRTELIFEDAFDQYLVRLFQE